MKTFTLTPQHVDQVLDLVRHDFSELELDRDYLTRNLFDDPDAAPELRFGVSDGRELVAAAAAVPRKLAPRAGEASTGHIKLFHIRELERQGRTELALSLLGRLESELKSRGCDAVTFGGAAPVYLLPGVPKRRQRLARFIEAAGYTVQMVRSSMTLPLNTLRDSSFTAATDADVDRLASGGLTLRRAHPDSADEDILQVVPQAAALSPTWATELTFALGYGSGASVWLALDGNRLAAFAVSRLWAANAFGPMATLPDYRGRRIGVALLKKALADIGAGATSSTAVISWIGPAEYYRSLLGAAESLHYDVFKKDLVAADSTRGVG